MRQRGRENSELAASKPSQQATPVNPNPIADFKASGGSANQGQGAPDTRRRALIAGLATAPVLLSLTSRSALGFDIDCSAFASLVVGGSPTGLPEQVHNVPDHALQNMYEAQCKEGGGPGGGTGNTNGNSNGNATGNATGNSNH